MEIINLKRMLPKELIQQIDNVCKEWGGDDNYKVIYGQMVILRPSLGDQAAFDVIATALHFPGGMDVVSRRSSWCFGEKDTDYVYGLYFEQLEKMLDYTYFDVICHIDLVKKFGRKPSRSFDREVDDILSKIKEKDLTMEVNTSGYNHPIQKPYPSLDMIRKCHEKGIGITLGSDAHKPEDVGQHYERALPMILSAGYRHLATFTKRKRSEIPIKERVNIHNLNEVTDSNASK